MHAAIPLIAREANIPSVGYLLVTLELLLNSLVLQGPGMGILSTALWHQSAPPPSQRSGMHYSNSELKKT
jgi:hypothetical protein